MKELVVVVVEEVQVVAVATELLGAMGSLAAMGVEVEEEKVGA